VGDLTSLPDDGSRPIRSGQQKGFGEFKVREDGKCQNSNPERQHDNSRFVAMVEFVYEL
jgi:hypothetical protein